MLIINVGLLRAFQRYVTYTKMCVAKFFDFDKLRIWLHAKAHSQNMCARAHMHACVNTKCTIFQI